MRRILIPAAALVLTITMGVCGGMTAEPAEPAESAESAGTKPTHLLSSTRKAGQIDRVEADLTVVGYVSQRVDEEVKRMKMSVQGKLYYDEKTLEMSADAAGRRRSVRYYDEAEAAIGVAEARVKPTLDARRRLVAVEVDGTETTLFSPQSELTADELDLIDILGNSLLLDRLLPEKPVSVGDRWKLPKELIVAMLRIDAASTSEVSSELTELTEVGARFELTGRIKGTWDGAAAEIELQGKYRFNRKTGRIDWVGLLAKVNRDIGAITRGTDSVVRLIVTVAPKQQSDRLSDESLAGLSLEPTDKLTRLACGSSSDGWQLTHGRQWYSVSDQHDPASLKLVEQGKVVAQCKIAALPKLTAGKVVFME
ncbi:MAG: hypothetical protein HQ567_04380 [Candidatus Nealsonbacteria bacterium]|nr:hypothetical protein [Candidatus Nealsonbacteria bacterium]